MNRPIRASLVLAALLFFVHALFAQEKSATCYVFVKEGASAEGNSLYLSKMGLPAEALSRVAPTRFDFSGKSFKLSSSGSFSYEAESPVLKGRSDKLALYSVDVKFKAGPYPKATKTIDVQFSFSDIVKGGEAVQPAEKAIQLAAAKAGMKSGTAWILDMQMPSKGEFSAKVGLAK
jgi:hypothetical protein